MTRILVTGATGNVGSNVVHELRAQGISVRAFVRDRAKAENVLPRDVDIAVGDFEEPGSIASALRDIDRVFLCCATGPSLVEQEVNAIDAARSAGVDLIVQLSALGAHPGSPLPGQDWMGRVEQHLRASGAPALVLQGNWYMSNLFASADTIRNSGMLFAAAGGGKVSMIDPRDVAAAAAAVITADGHAGRTYVLTGPEAITYHDAAAAIAAATGRPVAFVDVTEKAARAAFEDAGLPDWLITHLENAFRVIRDGGLEQVNDVVCALTGREPHTIADFAQDNVAAFTP
jgi:uncharacterized protein YbjT (DUF2867 family)